MNKIFKAIIFSFFIMSCNNCSAVVTDIYTYGVYETSIANHIQYRWHNASSANVEMSGNFRSSEIAGGYVTNWARRYIECTGKPIIYETKVYWSCIGCIQYQKTYGEFTSVTNTNLLSFAQQTDGSGKIGLVHTGNVMHFYDPLADKYSISGDTCGISNVELYIYDGSNYQYLTKDIVSSTNFYSFDIINNTIYKIIFSDGHEYIFTCTENKIYDRDLCEYFTINIYDNCANLLLNPSVDIYKCADIPAETKLIYQGSDSSIDLLMGVDVNVSDRIDVYIDTTDGTEHRIIYADLTTDNLYHSYINWDMTIHVVDDDTDTNIQYANVICTQGCSINLPNQKTAQTQSNGKVVFTGLSNQNMVINVEKSDYTIYSQTINPGSVFDCWSTGGSYTVYLNSTNASDNWNNNTHNDSENINGEGNTTLPDNTQWGCGVYFKNTNGIIVNQINDSDAYVDLYYWAKMKDCTTATLKFQEQLYTTWYDNVVYTILNNSYEYRRILNANFTDHTNNYRGYIYNSTCGCNDIQKLKIINQTYEQETNYQNLSAGCKFQNKLSENQIDYRAVVSVLVYANSTNATLMGITAYLMNQTTVVDSKVLNWADFTTNYGYYIWLPNYKYTSGYNYTVNITGYNGYQLDTDEVWTADIVGNSLTIRVKDNHGVGITQATVFVEGWGSQSLTSGTYGVITGLPDGDCQYKATKSGYITSGWDAITLSGADETVTCILTKQSTESITGYKLKDQEVKAFLIPLLYLLFVLIIVGGVINAAKP